MADQLLVRLYNVGLGDCIYLRIPDAVTGKDVHVLIDCGNKFGSLDLLGQHIGKLAEELDDGTGKKRLDLLVVSHPHEDHHKGFEEDYFKGIQIGRIWLSPAYDRENPNAKGFRALKDAAVRGLKSMGFERPGVDDLWRSMEFKSPEVGDLWLSLTKPQALTMLNTTLPERNGIEPLYVTAQTPESDLLAFEDPEIKLKVLGPMEDVDGWYVGGAGLLDAPSALGLKGMTDAYEGLYPDAAAVEVKQPANISVQDFQRLRNRVGANALAAAELTSKVENNLSVVLLLEWHGWRLLFPGDAEWKSGGAERGSCNGSWNVMWKERHDELSKPIHFLKIGHHGSENATPWAPPNKKGKAHPISQILDALLPRPGAGEQPVAVAVASTRRTDRWPSIPNPKLMVEIGSRIAEARTQYVEDPPPKGVEAGEPQPQRTDLEEQVTGAPVPYIEHYFPK